VTLSELRDWVRGYLDQDDVTLPDTALATMTEAVEGYCNRELMKHPRMYARLFWPLGAGKNTLPLPENAVDILGLKLDGVRIEQYPHTLEEQAATYGGFVHMGDCLRIYPVPTANTTYQLDVSLALESLASPANVDATNWLSRQFADVYQYGVLAEAAGYLRDPSNQQVWRAEFADRVERVRRQGWTSATEDAVRGRLG
jgi:hypothetical protein